MKVRLNAVAFYDEGRWIAQGLEHDIAASSESIFTLLDVFERAVVANLSLNRKMGRVGLEGIPPAPELFREMFESAQNYIGSVEDDPQNPIHLSSMRLGQLAVN